MLFGHWFGVRTTGHLLTLAKYLRSRLPLRYLRCLHLLHNLSLQSNELKDEIKTFHPDILTTKVRLSSKDFLDQTLKTAL